MGSITLTPTAEKQAAFTLAGVLRAASTAVNGITPTPTAEKYRAAFTLAVV